MGALYDDFEKSLDVWSRRWAKTPRREMLHLFLLALEREEIVSVGYREEAIAQRLRSMPIDEDVRDIVRHALIWAWKDEEMHAIYIRGAIIRLGSLRLRLTAYLRQIAGGIGGWSTSVLMHVRWRDAPLSRLLARLSTTAGALTGNVPKAVRKHLDYSSFREFCAFNIDAEKTARTCWSRIRELAANERDLPQQLHADFARIEADEERHGRIFQLLFEAFDDEDRLAPGHDASTLVARLAEIGAEFLPRHLRKHRAADHPLGSGADVHVVRGDAAEEKEVVFGKLLDESRLLEAVDARVQHLGKTRREMVIAIKPTFMLGYHRNDPSVVTDPAVLDQLARFLREAGCREVLAMESPNIYDEFYQHRTVQAVADYFGFSSRWYRLVDASVEQTEHQFARGMAQYTVSRSWRDADFRISLGKMRSHPVELAYLTVANVEWLGARCDQFMFCERQAQRETAIMMLLDACPPHFAILEAWSDVPDGLVGVMGCAKPRSPLRFYASSDALALDIVAARHMGIADPRQSSILRAAFHWFGVSESEPRVIGCDLSVAPWKGPYHSEVSTLLSLVSYPVYVVGSGRGTLFVPQMDEQAFPPIEPPSFALRTSRRAVQRLIGLDLGLRGSPR